jgi:hypothetical protein
MSRPQPPGPCALAAAVLLSRGVELGEVLDELGRAFDRPRHVTGELSFGDTCYYEPEMGPGLRRVFAGLEGLWDAGDLAEIKLRANELERRWAKAGRRRVNLDPGIVGLDHFVLASGKPAGHRVYLGRGIHAEVEYMYVEGSFRPLPWTYPDYRLPTTIAFFNRLRELHKNARKETP